MSLSQLMLAVIPVSSILVLSCAAVAAPRQPTRASAAVALTLPIETPSHVTVAAVASSPSPLAPPPARAGASSVAESSRECRQPFLKPTWRSERSLHVAVADFLLGNELSSESNQSVAYAFAARLASLRDTEFRRAKLERMRSEVEIQVVACSVPGAEEARVLADELDAGVLLWGQASETALAVPRNLTIKNTTLMHGTAVASGNSRISIGTVDVKFGVTTRRYDVQSNGYLQGLGLPIEFSFGRQLITNLLDISSPKGLDGKRMRELALLAFAVHFLQLGRCADAIPLIEEAKRSIESTLALDVVDLHTAVCYLNAAEDGKFEAISQRLLERGNPLLTALSLQMSGLYWSSSRPQQAVNALKRAIELVASADLEPQLRREVVLEMQMPLAVALMKSTKPSDGVDLLFAVVKDLRASTFPSSRHNLADALSLVAAVERQWNRPDRAEAAAREAYDIVAELDAHQGLVFAEYSRNLALALVNNAKLDEARASAAEALKVLVDGHFDASGRKTADFAAILGRIETALQDFEAGGIHLSESAHLADQNQMPSLLDVLNTLLDIALHVALRAEWSPGLPGAIVVGGRYDRQLRSGDWIVRYGGTAVKNTAHLLMLEQVHGTSMVEVVVKRAEESVALFLPRAKLGVYLLCSACALPKALWLWRNGSDAIVRN